MKNLEKIQLFLEQFSIDGWLIYDFNHQNPLAYKVLGLDDSKHVKRRFFYFIPKKGNPIKILHKIEAHVLNELDGDALFYCSWKSLHDSLAQILRNVKNVAMEFSPLNNNPYICKVDAGTLDLIRSYGVEVVSSGAFLHYFTSVLSETQIQSHIRAAQKLEKICSLAFSWILENLQKNVRITEYDVMKKISQDLGKFGLVTESTINVSVNQNSANPHYVVEKSQALEIKHGDFILIDMWAKEDLPNSVFADITKVAVAASQPTEKQKQVFSVVREAQKAAYELVLKAFDTKQPILGCEVDDAARLVIEKAGFGQFFTHRTGHNIGTDLHGSGTHLDNFETHDDRTLIASSCFSIEPGIYLPGEFGIRLEHDVIIDSQGKVLLTGGVQEEILCLF